jgi:hypothetical protein
VSICYAAETEFELFVAELKENQLYTSEVRSVLNRALLICSAHLLCSSAHLSCLVDRLRRRFAGAKGKRRKDPSLTRSAARALAVSPESDLSDWPCCCVQSALRPIGRGEEEDGEDDDEGWLQPSDEEENAPPKTKKKATPKVKAPKSAAKNKAPKSAAKVKLAAKAKAPKSAAKAKPAAMVSRRLKSKVPPKRKVDDSVVQQRKAAEVQVGR